MSTGDLGAVWSTLTCMGQRVLLIYFLLTLALKLLAQAAQFSPTEGTAQLSPTGWHPRLDSALTGAELPGA